MVSDSNGERPSRYIALRVEDAASGLEFAEFEMTFAAFGELISGGGGVPAVADLRLSERIGKYVQVKVQTVWFPKGTKWYEHKPRQEKKALQPFLDAVAALEIDGWKGETYLGGQIRYGDDKEGYDVTFRRYLDEKPDRLRVYPEDETADKHYIVAAIGEVIIVAA